MRPLKYRYLGKGYQFSAWIVWGPHILHWGAEHGLAEKEKKIH